MVNDNIDNRLIELLHCGSKCNNIDNNLNENVDSLNKKLQLECEDLIEAFDAMQSEDMIGDTKLERILK